MTNGTHRYNVTTMRLTTTVPADFFAPQPVPEPGECVPIKWGELIISAQVHEVQISGPTATLDLSIHAEVRTWGSNSPRRWPAPPV